MKAKMTEEKAREELKERYGKAEKTIGDKGKLDKLLKDAEEKLKKLPKFGEELSHIPVFIAMVKSYILKEYTSIPWPTILAIVSALIYFASPIDVIPDILPVAGHVDDVAVVLACAKMIDVDIKEYIKWRDAKKTAIEV